MRVVAMRLDALKVHEVVQKGLVNVGGVPNFGFGGGDSYCLVANLDAEITFFKGPLLVIVDKCEVICRNYEFHGLGFARFKLDFVKLAKTLNVG